MPDIITIFAIIVATFVISSIITKIYISGRNRSHIQKIRLETENLRNNLATLEQQLHEEKEELRILREKYNELLQNSAAYKAEKDTAIARQKELQQELEELAHTREKMQQKIAHYEKQIALANQQVEDANIRMQDWKKLQEEMTQAAKASLAEAGNEIVKTNNEISSKLLEDHKREAEAAKREAEERKKAQQQEIQQATAKLMEQFQEVTKSVAMVKHQSDNNREQMEKVMRALTNPAGAGQMAEIGLENSLKNLGLEANRDFSMQYHIKETATAEGQRTLRPDAIVFLPQNMVMVVDCKASKHIIELSEVEVGSNAEKEALEKFRKTMYEHIKKLSGKDYKSAVEKQYKNAGKGKHIGQMFNIMYVPHEAAIERLKKFDSSFQDKVDKAGIILAGPASLAGLFSLAKMNIAAARRAENEEKIIKILENMLENIATAFDHVNKIGKGLEQSMSAFGKFTRSVNRYIIPKMHQLDRLGVHPTKNKPIPAPFIDYEIYKKDSIVDVEARQIASIEENGAENIGIELPASEKSSANTHREEKNKLEDIA